MKETLGKRNIKRVGGGGGVEKEKDKKKDKNKDKKGGKERQIEKGKR